MAGRFGGTLIFCQELKLKERAATEKSIEIKLLVVFDQIRVGKRYVHADYIYYEASPSSGGVGGYAPTNGDGVGGNPAAWRVRGNTNEDTGGDDP